ncbi:peptide deformylase [bacterium]|nr:peptide deformylase [bacterium]
MAIIPIVIHPDPILRLPTDRVTEFDPTLHQLIADMIDTMHSDRGVGLAAPQIGILKKVIVVSYKKREFAIINPEIVATYGSQWGEEGCLSIPNTRLNVQRASRIEVIGQTPNGKSIRLKEKGFVARILQHEIDHLNGILIIDKGLQLPDEKDYQ